MMIRNSFVFLERVSQQREKAIRAQGFHDWALFLRAETVRGISNMKKQYYDRRLKEAQEALYHGHPSYFVGKLPSKEMWRLYDHFKDEAAFLDVEINTAGKIVIVGISNYYQSNFFVHSVNLEKELLEKELLKYKLLVTFNGSAFDLPKLRKQFGILIHIPHIDLKPLCLKVGLKGGLKEIEKQLKLKRPAHLYGNPVDLWKAFHASADREYLDLLLDYNREDVENLKGVMEWVYKELKDRV